MPFHIDGTERSGRAQVFTRAATDTPLGIDDRNLDRARVTAVRGNHQYGSRWAMAGTVATIHAIGQRNTVLFYPYSVTDARGRFFSNGYRSDGSCGTDFAASGTFRTAIATLVGHFGLHQSRQVGGGAEHSIGTCRHTKLASCTMSGKVACAQGSWRNNRCGAFGYLLVLDDCQSAIYFLLLRMDSTFFSCAWIADVTASTAVADRKLRREAPSTPPDGELGVSILEASPSGEVWRGLRGLRGLRLMAPCRHVSMQSMHATQRL